MPSQGHGVPGSATSFLRQSFSKTLVIIVRRPERPTVVFRHGTCPRLPETEQYQPGEKLEGRAGIRASPLPTTRAETDTSPTALPAPVRALRQPATRPTTSTTARTSTNSIRILQRPRGRSPNSRKVLHRETQPTRSRTGSQPNLLDPYSSLPCLWY